MDELLLHEISRLDGMLYGLLTDDERQTVDEAVNRGLARRVWEGGTGWMGLSKVRVS